MPEKSVIQSMHLHFASGVTRPAAFRRAQLKKLYSAIKTRESDILLALKTDLHKSVEEAYITEVGQVLNEIRFALKHLDQWTRRRRRRTPLAFFPGKSYVIREPLGVALIISPWNYPFQLLLNPLVGAIAGGNCALCKPSEFAPATTTVLARLLAETFPPEYICLVQGNGKEVIAGLLQDDRPDHIFFTGSISVGREILQMAAPRLIPVTLELGGKSPVIVDKGANIGVAARRIVMGKFINAGQTCVAPDYLLVHYSVKDELVEAIKETLQAFFGKDPKLSPDYARIIHPGRFHTLAGYINEGKVLCGGVHSAEDLYIAPTLLEGVSPESPLMQNEIFGPLLPVISFGSKEEAMTIIQRHPWPLALYIFSSDKRVKAYFTETVAFGGGCINNTLVHFGSPTLPVGGVGFSGMGRYHGVESFNTFTHPKSIMDSGTWMDPSLKYPPFKGKLGLFRRLFK